MFRPLKEARDSMMTPRLNRTCSIDEAANSIAKKYICRRKPCRKISLTNKIVKRTGSCLIESRFSLLSNPAAVVQTPSRIWLAHQTVLIYFSVSRPLRSLIRLNFRPGSFLCVPVNRRIRWGGVKWTSGSRVSLFLYFMERGSTGPSDWIASNKSDPRTFFT